MDKLFIWMIHLDRIRWIENDKISSIISKAEIDIHNLEKAGFKYACIINESDIPYNITISKQEKKVFKKIAIKLKERAKLKLWICVLYNDWKATLDIAKLIDADFIRIDTFVDLVESDAWIIYPEAEEIIKYKKKLELEKVKMFTDIHPKYKKMLENKTLIESAKQAKDMESDWVIITWNKSWEIIDLNDIKKLRDSSDINIFLWSWASKENIREYRNYINWAFVGSSLKENWKISFEKAKSFMDFCNKL